MNIVVLGTGTDVGKTHVTAALAHYLSEQRVDFVAWKPIITGIQKGVDLSLDPTNDASILAAASHRPLIAPYQVFATPVSPFRAAQIDGATVRVDAIVSSIDDLGKRNSVALIETAGGAFSPLARGVVNAHLAARSNARVVLVAPDRLGVVHDVTATLIALRSVGVVPFATVISAVEVPDASSGANSTELRDLGITDVTAEFPRVSYDHEWSQAAAEQLWRKLRS